jgi:hypothetical protein
VRLLKVGGWHLIGLGQSWQRERRGPGFGGRPPSQVLQRFCSVGRGRFWHVYVGWGEFDGVGRPLTTCIGHVYLVAAVML